MVIAVTLRLEELFHQGKDFKWERPLCCPKCKGKLWSHGFRSRLFQGFPSVLYLKRYQCQSCEAIIQLGPSGFWLRLQSSIQEIFEVLRYRLSTRFWPPGISRQRAGHWLRGFHKLFLMNPQWQVPGQGMVQALEVVAASGLRFV